MPGGKEGDTLEIRYQSACGAKLETAYVYEWQKIEEAASPTPEQPADTEGQEEPAEAVDDADQADPMTDPDLLWLSGENRGQIFTDIVEVRKTADGEYIPSVHAFSDLYGEVLIRHGDDPLGWELAKLDTVIYEGDVIWVSYNSGAVISNPDGQLRLKDEVSVMAENRWTESKITLLFGKVVANLKKMWREGGVMNVEMSQAVAGIKGTTFILEEDGTTSTVKVLEGTVEVTPRGGEPVTVSAEEVLSIVDGVVGEVKPLPLSEELSNWDEDTQAYILTLLEDAASSEDAAEDGNDVTGGGAEQERAQTTRDPSADQTGEDETHAEDQETIDGPPEEPDPQGTEPDEGETGPQDGGFIRYLVGGLVLLLGVGIVLVVRRYR